MPQLTLKSLNQSGAQAGSLAIKTAGDLFDRAFKRVGQGAERIVENDQALYDEQIDRNTQAAIASLTGKDSASIQRIINRPGANVDTKALNEAGRSEIATNDADTAKLTAASLLASQKANAANTLNINKESAEALRVITDATSKTTESGRNIAATELETENKTRAALELARTTGINQSNADVRDQKEAIRKEEAAIMSGRIQKHAKSFGNKSKEDRQVDWAEAYVGWSEQEVFSENAVGRLSGPKFASMVGDLEQKGANIRIPDGKGGYLKGKENVEVSPLDVNNAMRASINTNNVFSDDYIDKTFKQRVGASALDRRLDELTRGVSLYKANGNKEAQAELELEYEELYNQAEDLKSYISEADAKEALKAANSMNKTDPYTGRVSRRSPLSRYLNQ